jgi:trehalose 6-phosphate phosphatase
VNVAEQNDVWVPFFDRVRHASSRVLLLDYDGTLAPFTPDRARAFPYREIPELVSKIMRHNTRVVLVSGRAATELLFLSRIQPQPEIWGSHGVERLYPDGAYEVHTPDLSHRHALHLANRSLRECGLNERMEIKPGAIAVHWRGLSSEKRAHIEKKVRAACAPIAAEAGLELLPFDGGIELRAPGRNKGDAVNTILAEAGEGAAAAYLGDDQTDENAFRAIKGRGLAVLVRSEPRESVADIYLRPPDELVHFLRDWLFACGAEK